VNLVRSVENPIIQPLAHPHNRSTFKVIEPRTRTNHLKPALQDGAASASNPLSKPKHEEGMMQLHAKAGGAGAPAHAGTNARGSARSTPGQTGGNI